MVKVLSDIFSMKFDIVIPLSGCLAALVLGAVLFLIRYISYRRTKRKFEKKARK